MRYRQLGQSGLTVSVVGLGGNNFGRACDLAQTRAVVDVALELGVTLIDTAEMYGNGASERVLGEVLKGRRQQVVLATKFGHLQNATPDNASGSRRNIRRAVEASLERLQTDYIDLYYLHQPDARTPIEETLDALNELIAEGKVRYIGTSNLPAWQVVEAEWTARRNRQTRFIVSQNHYNLLERSAEKELVPACLRYGIGVIPFFPLASGLLTGKYRRGEPAPAGTRLAARPAALSDQAFDKVEAIERYARERGTSLLQVAIGGLAAQPGVASVIAGATRPEQVRANVTAGEWVPSSEDLAAMPRSE